MTISTNRTHTPDSDLDNIPPGGGSGAFADGLTWVRLVITPIIMALILWRWPEPQIAVLASFLFIVAALTDIFDDFFGGGAKSTLRKYGYLDDMADTILIVGSLVALSVVVLANGLMSWIFAVPVTILVLREGLVGLIKGGALKQFGWADNFASSAKGAFAMLGTALLVGAPWLTNILDRARAEGDQVMTVFATGSPAVWTAGQICLWIAALFSVWSGYKILTYRFGDA